MLAIRWDHILKSGIVGALLAVVAPGAAVDSSGYLCGECMDWLDEEWPWAFHEFTSDTCVDPSQSDCYECDGDCHGDPQFWLCDFHDNCDPDEYGGEELLASVLDYHDAGDLEGLASILAANPEYTKHNVARQAIQVIGCGGAVIAHLPISNAALVAATP